jgi:hypothetical protein
MRQTFEIVHSEHMSIERVLKRPEKPVAALHAIEDALADRVEILGVLSDGTIRD